MYAYAPRWLPPLSRWAVLLVLFLASLLVFLAAVPVCASNVDIDGAKARVEALLQENSPQALAQNDQIDRKIDLYRNLLASYFDMELISRFVLSRAWRTAVPAERERFVSLFDTLNVYIWLPRLRKYNGQTLMVGSVVPDGTKGAIVDSEFRDNGTNPGFAVPVQIQWRLRKRSETWKIVDVIVAGISMAVTYRSQYGAFLSGKGTEGVKALNEQLEQQIRRARRDIFS